MNKRTSNAVNVSLVGGVTHQQIISRVRYINDVRRPFSHLFFHLTTEAYLSYETNVRNGIRSKKV